MPLVLLNNGADINALREEGLTILDRALKPEMQHFADHQIFIEFLKQNGAKRISEL